MNFPSAIPESVAFGRFRVLPHRRELLDNGEPIKLGGRAFDLLMALIETPGAVVSKYDVMARAWQDRVVSETNLQTQILALRQALGVERDMIRTVAGRGYQFTGEIRIPSPGPDKRAAARLLAAADDAAASPTNLPQPASELIGRNAEVEEILDLVERARLVTLTGSGGIGKTRLALAVARRLLAQFPDGAWLVEFSALSDPSLIPATIAGAVGLELLGGGKASAQRIAQALGARRLLLVMDTCEHVIGAAATMAEAVLQAGAAVHIIATSREPLQAEGEQLFPVPPLAVPAADAADLSEYGAVRLFVERARAAGADLAPDRGRATAIATICRRLDGIPLAIEMAAARVAALGLDGLASRLDDRFQLLTRGRRTALARHQTLRATLDWSHELLAESERLVLRRLSVFAGAFTLEAAAAVAASADIASPEVVDGLASLVAKSLVVAEVDGAVPRYRLLDTTRAYALEKLSDSGEREQLERRHAEYYRDLFDRAEAELEMRPTADWLSDYGRQIDNLRVSLDWAFSPGGDLEIGAGLTAAAAPLWLHLSLLDECRGRVERALGALAVGNDGDMRREMKLCAALCVSLLYASDPQLPAIGKAWTRALEIAETLDDREYQLRSLWGLWFFNWSGGRQIAALAFAQKFHALTARGSDPNDRLVGERLIGVSHHLLGDQANARRHLERMLAHYVPPLHGSHVIRFQSDQRVTASTFLSRVLWLQGFPDQAIQTAERGVAEARASNHVVSLCCVLAHAVCPIALLIGDLGVAGRYAEMLIDLSTRYSLAPWRAFGRSYQGAVAIKRGDVSGGMQLLRSGFDELGDVTSSFRGFALLCEMAEALGRDGQIGLGLSALEEAIVYADETEERWGLPELLRIKGELLLLQGAPGAAAAAEDCFRQALDWSRRQGALSWELRAAASLERLMRDQSRSADAIGLLQPVYDRFTEGFDTVDLKAAKALLREFG